MCKRDQTQRHPIPAKKRETHMFWNRHGSGWHSGAPRVGICDL